MLSIALLLIAGATLEGACEVDAAPSKPVRAVADGIIAADNAGEIDRVLGFYAADAVLLPPNEAPVIGREGRMVDHSSDVAPRQCRSETIVVKSVPGSCRLEARRGRA